MQNNKNYFLTLLPVIFLGVLMYYFFDIFVYILSAKVLSMIGAPLVGFFRKYVGQSTAAILTLLSFILVFLLLIRIFVPPLSSQIRGFANIDFEKVSQGLEKPLTATKEWFTEKGIIENTELNEIDVEQSFNEDYNRQLLINLDSLKTYQSKDTIEKNEILALYINIDNKQGVTFKESKESFSSINIFKNVKENIFHFLNPSQISGFFGNIIGFFGNFFIASLSILFISFFFLKEENLSRKILTAITPSNYEEKSLIVMSESSKLLIKYFIGIIAQVTIVTIIVFFGLTLFGIKNALLIAFFAALMNIIPYIGPLFGASFGIIITISSYLETGVFDGMGIVIFKVIIVFGVMQLIDNFIVQPFILGKSVKAHPLEIFIVILMAGKIAGPLGMVLAIPVYTVFRVFAKSFLGEFELVKRITHGL